MKLVLQIGFLWILQIGTTIANSGQHAAGPNFKVVANDFRNTQKERTCMLANLDLEVELKYKVGDTAHSSSILLPHTATTNGSYCDKEFTSLLSLSSNGMVIRMTFSRTPEQPGKTQRTYCVRCDDGNWWLSSISINIDDINRLAHALPKVRIQSHATLTKTTIENAGQLTIGVPVTRAYGCKSRLIATTMRSTNYTLLNQNATVSTDWGVTMKFRTLQVQPFLVTGTGFNDPLLCTDVSTFHIVIIIVPIVYFTIFVIYHRVKEVYGCPPKPKHKQGMEKLMESSTVSPNVKSYTDDSGVTSDSGVKVRITFTSPENTENSLV
ncbi:uncharacterized protein LOC100180024 [Ciona intestinalis]